MLPRLISRILQFILALAGTKIMTSVLQPEEVGKISLLMTAYSFFAMLLMNPIGMYISRNINNWEKINSTYNNFQTYLLYIITAAITSAAITAFITTKIISLGFSSLMAAAIISGNILIGSIHQTATPLLNLLNRTSAFSTITIVTSVLNITISLILSIAINASAEIWLLGPLVSQAIMGVIAYKILFNKKLINSTLQKNNFNSIIKSINHIYQYSWPISVSATLGWLHMQGYRLLIADKIGLKEIGLFVTGYGLAAAMLTALETILSTWLLPKFYQQASSDEKLIHNQAWQKYAEILIPGTLIGSVALISIGPEILYFSLGEKFQGTVIYFQLGTIAESGRMIVSIFTLLPHLRMKTNQLILPNLSGALFSSILIYLTTPVYGIKIAPLIIVTGAIITTTGIYISNRNTDYEIKPITKKLLIYAIMSIINIIITYEISNNLSKDTNMGHFYVLITTGLCWTPIAYLFLRDIKNNMQNFK